jgi:hypothetical protein
VLVYAECNIPHSQYANDGHCSPSIHRAIATQSAADIEEEEDAYEENDDHHPYDLRPILRDGALVVRGYYAHSEIKYDVNDKQRNQNPCLYGNLAANLIHFCHLL